MIPHSSSSPFHLAFRQPMSNTLPGGDARILRFCIVLHHPEEGISHPLVNFVLIWSKHTNTELGKLWSTEPFYPAHRAMGLQQHFRSGGLRHHFTTSQSQGLSGCSSALGFPYCISVATNTTIPCFLSEAHLTTGFPPRPCDLLRTNPEEH